MMAGDGSSGGGIPGGPLGVLLAALLGLGAAGAVTWVIAGGGGGGGDKTPVAVASQEPATIAAPTVAVNRQPTTAAGGFNPAGIDKEALKEGFEDAAVLVLTAYGSPARVSANADNPDERLSGAFVKQCIPDDIYPDPCVSYLIVKRGASVTVSAGDSKSGYWPALDFVRGACNIAASDTGVDQTCTFTMFQDADIVAVYYGGENPGLSHYNYPTCPTQRGNAPPAWTSRCR